MRDAMLAGISPKDVELEYKFFVGKPAGWKKLWTSRKLGHEMEEHDDISVSRISDTKRRLAERRLVALNWVSISFFSVFWRSLNTCYTVIFRQDLYPIIATIIL